MTDNVIKLDMKTKAPMDADIVLQGAIDKGLHTVVILGWDKEENSYYAANTSDGGEIIWLLERLKLGLITGEFAN